MASAAHGYDVAFQQPCDAVAERGRLHGAQDLRAAKELQVRPGG